MKVKWAEFLLEKIPFGGNLGLVIAVTLFIFFLAFFLGKPVGYIVRKALQRLGRKNKFLSMHIVSQIEKPVSMMSIALIWLVVFNFMPPLWKSMGGIPLFLSTPLIGGIKILIKIVVGSGLVWICYNLVDELLAFLMKRFFDENEQNSNFKVHFLPFIKRFMKIIVLCFGGLLVMQNLGINVVSLLAGLGLGGVVVALAARDSAENILAYVNIMLDRPFFVGDWICFNDIEGIVIEVGLRSSKLKTFYDSVITVPNSILTKANIDNMGKRKARRTRIYLDVQYDTSPEKMEEFIAGIKNILINSSAVKSDYFQVYFNEFSASSLKIIINFFLFVKDWEHELQEKQNIFMAILKLAKKLQVEFAFPTQTIHLDSAPKEISFVDSKTPGEQKKNFQTETNKK